MLRWIFSYILIFNSFFALAQNTLTVKIANQKDSSAIIGAILILSPLKTAAIGNAEGLIIIKDIPDGKFTLNISALGYQKSTLTVNLPRPQKDTLLVHLIPEEEELEEIIVTSTRSSRTIEAEPTRIEAISGEELEEKGNMKPGDIRMLLNESTGIQTQQTSATSYNSSIRIQGLDGKYTQILKDGFPLYGAFSGGLSILQIPPLDLKQVEVIKGASSTLYGEGAIAGLVNLISKTPTEEKELNLMLNGTSALGLDASLFYGKKKDKIGTTVFAAYNLGSAYDPANIGLTAIPQFNRFTLNPKLFVDLSSKTNLVLGINTTFEERTGGDISYIKKSPTTYATYFEENSTQRISSQATLKHQLNEGSQINFKNSYNYYNRTINIPSFIFKGIQNSSFSEVNYQTKKAKTEWILGLNLWTDQFKQQNVMANQALDYDYTTLGGFIQNTTNVSDKIVLETGLRTDYQNQYGLFVLPRLSVLYTINESLNLRFGGGLGYKTPTIFTEDTERIQYRNVLPIQTANVEAEQSIGTNLDVNYKTLLTDDLFFSINTLLFYTQVDNPLILNLNSNNSYEFTQPKGNINTKGLETNVKLSYQDFKFFVGYTLADVTQKQNGITSSFPLVAKHRLNNVLMYEIEEKLKIGLEAYYFSKQNLNDGKTGKPYWLNGLMAEKIWEKFSLFINFENIFDVRQSRFDTIYTGSISNPQFRDIYAPVDGFVINGGIKLKL
jgi:outer membrane receptor for ferrienterochelin and colicins